MKRVYLAIMLPAVLRTLLVCGNPNQSAAASGSNTSPVASHEVAPSSDFANLSRRFFTRYRFTFHNLTLSG